jgi:ubiquinone/menaquinone biosynthesis C-methylase UbiE
MERYVIAGGDRGFQRLAVLARLWEPTTLQLFRDVGVGPGMQCLDLGCGGGAVTLAMARLVGPDGHATGMDMDEVKLALGRESAAAQGLSNVTLKTMNVYDFRESGSYDLVYCRFLLQHLSRPVEVVAAMWEAVRPGGVLVVEDADFDGQFCEPPNPGFDFWVEKYQQVLSLNGGDPHSGRRVPGYFREVGVPEPSVAIKQRLEQSGEGKSMPHSTIETTADAIVEEGLATREQIDAALAGLQALADDEVSVVGTPRTVQVWARRSA